MASTTLPMHRIAQFLPRSTSLLFLLLLVPLARGFDYEGHRAINQLALSTLPADFPDFVRTAENRERIAFLSGEPDRWRNTPELTLRHANNPDHFLDIEDLTAHGIRPEQLSPFRYEFIGQLAVARAAHPENFPTNVLGKENDRLQGIPGLLPWTINEHYSKLKSTFSSLKVYEEFGTPVEIANARANIVHLMGVMGHYVGDSAQPLHTTKHFNGWVGENPNGYTTRKTFHSWIDGGYIRKTGGIDANHLRSRLKPAHSLWPGDPKVPHGDVFRETTGFLMEQFKLVEPLYQLDRDGKLSGEGESGLEGKVFMEQQFIKAAQQLGNLWYSAWQQAVPDTYLRSQLTRRQPTQ